MKAKELRHGYLWNIYSLKEIASFFVYSNSLFNLITDNESTELVCCESDRQLENIAASEFCSKCTNLIKNLK